MMKKVCFVILHYGDINVTDDCVTSILAMDHQEYIHILIVDNEIRKSESERKNIIEKYKQIESVTVLQIKENGGFSHANNCGYLYAREKLQTSIIVVCNNDIQFTQPNTIDILWEIAEQEDCHVLGPDVIKASSKEHQNPLDQRIRTLEEVKYTIRMNHIALKGFPLLYPFVLRKNTKAEEKMREERLQNEEYFLEEHRDCVLFGACLIYMPPFVEKEKKAFYPETNFYYEEYILGLRCEIKDYKTLYTPKIRVLHESGAVTKKTMKDQKKRLRFLLENTLQSSKIYYRFLKKCVEENKLQDNI